MRWWTILLPLMCLSLLAKLTDTGLRYGDALCRLRPIGQDLLAATTAMLVAAPGSATIRSHFSTGLVDMGSQTGVSIGSRA